MRLSNVEYYSAEEAFKEASQRLEDDSVQRAVDDLVEGDEPFQGETLTNPTAVLARYVVQPNNELLAFYGLASKAGFSARVATALGEPFVSGNPEKVAAVKPPILWPKDQFTRCSIVDPSKRTGPMGELVTIYGVKLPAYQQSVCEVVSANPDLDIRSSFWVERPPTVDFSGWYTRMVKLFGSEHPTTKKSAAYYVAAMALYASGRAVLFEDFESGPNAASLRQFNQVVLEPAMEAVQAATGLDPIIVRLPYQKGYNVIDLRWLDEQRDRSIVNTMRRVQEVVDER